MTDDSDRDIPDARIAPTDAAERPRAVDLRDYVRFDLANGVGQRVLATDVLAVDVVCLEPGQEMGAREFATADVAYTVVGGQAWIVTDAEEVTLNPLQAVCIPAGVAHGIANEGADPLILHVTSSPPDEVPIGGSGPVVTPDPEVGKAARGGFAARRRRRR